MSDVSELAHDILAIAYEGARSGGDTGCVTLVEVVQHLADVLDVDEADVLRALAELGRTGNLVIPREPLGEADDE